MKKMLNKLAGFVMAGLILFTAAACAPDQGQIIGTDKAGGGNLAGKIIASGSTSMEDMMLALGESFMTVNPGVKVEIQGGGSGAGVKNASEGVTDIGNASRALKDEEKNLGLQDTIVAVDGIAIVINPANKVAGLTSRQIADIYTGKTTNWKDVGGDDQPIVAIMRESGSGTRDGFEEILDIKDATVGTEEVSETGIVKSKVAGNVNAIGYMSLGKVDETVKSVTVDGVQASDAAVKDGTYALQRPFLCLTKKGEASDLTLAFLEFILSPAGQEIVATQGYVKVG